MRANIIYKFVVNLPGIEEEKRAIKILQSINFQEIQMAYPFIHHKLAYEVYIENQYHQKIVLLKD